MNKMELISDISEISGLKKIDAEKVLDAFMSVVEKELVKGEDIRLVGFGTFSVAKRSQTEGRNPKTGESIIIPAKFVPKFKPGKQLKDSIANSLKK